MIVKIDDWAFDVAITATMEYSAKEAAEHCTCAYCRNFYTAVDFCYPELRPFLARFGLDVEAPDRMSPVDYSRDRIDYDPIYYVFGKIQNYGLYELSAGLANIVPSPMEGKLEGKPCFRLDLYEVSLPWVLDEPFEGGIPEPSPKSSWLGRMFRKNTE